MLKFVVVIKRIQSQSKRDATCVKKVKKNTSRQEQEAQILQQIKNKLISREDVL